MATTGATSAFMHSSVRLSGLSRSQQDALQEQLSLCPCPTEWHLRQLAELIGEDVQTVKAWVANRKRQEAGTPATLRVFGTNAINHTECSSTRAPEGTTSTWCPVSSEHSHRSGLGTSASGCLARSNSLPSREYSGLLDLEAWPVQLSPSALQPTLTTNPSPSSCKRKRQQQNEDVFVPDSKVQIQQTLPQFTAQGVFLGGSQMRQRLVSSLSI